MAIFAAGRFFEMITILETLRCGCMHFFTTMAIIAGHGVFAQMYISLTAVAEKLVADPAAVARRALVHRIGLGTKKVTINKPGTDVFGSAHMTGATAGMTGGAVALTTIIDLRPGIRAGSFLKKTGKGGQGCMQRLRCGLSYFLVTLSTSFLRIVYRGVSINSFMSSLFVRC
jgi:hypothetical protein